MHVDHVDGTGTDFYRITCEQDLEGIVAKLGSALSDSCRCRGLVSRCGSRLSPARWRRDWYARRASPQRRLDFQALAVRFGFHFLTAWRSQPAPCMKLQYWQWRNSGDVDSPAMHPDLQRG